MKHYICQTCGTQYNAKRQPIAFCPICEDERLYVKDDGQTWTTIEEMRENGYQVEHREEGEGLIGIGISPAFGFGQRALLLKTEHGNILWDCISYMDQEIIGMIKAEGGIDAIAISHPHYYGSMVEWAEKFDCPIYLHADDAAFVMRESDRITFWEGNRHVINEDVTIVRLGGHFLGSAVLHWEKGADGKGVLLTGDTIQLVADKRWVSFMYSYPNQIPLPIREIKQMMKRLESYPFYTLYGSKWGEIIREDAKVRVKKSAVRYIQVLDN
ncbi:MBL fold metallo-hydrolase [Priestia koreensis]|uniref:MBL fold metallo-hydrolase n=1 Tax=Priestia koreensis TaxID=284581 RepID=UPI00203DA794|nr:MBL fold metallo-hydrolase [Priestia koreensis]MCM3005038.1 MBL fold metallo-hydrolase [Priestia koreensis]